MNFLAGLFLFAFFSFIGVIAIAVIFYDGPAK